VAGTETTDLFKSGKIKTIFQLDNEGVLFNGNGIDFSTAGQFSIPSGSQVAAQTAGSIRR